MSDLPEADKFNVFVHPQIIVALKLEYLDRAQSRYGTIEVVPTRGNYFDADVTIARSGCWTQQEKQGTCSPSGAAGDPPPGLHGELTPKREKTSTHLECLSEYDLKENVVGTMPGATTVMPRNVPNLVVREALRNIILLERFYTSLTQIPGERAHEQTSKTK